VIYAGRIEKLPGAHDGRFSVIHAQRWAIVMDLITVQNQRKITNVIMLKFVRVAVQRTNKFCLFNQGEQEMFRNGIHDGVVYKQGY